MGFGNGPIGIKEATGVRHFDQGWFRQQVLGFGLHASAATALVIEVLRSAITNYGPPGEVLTDNGPTNGQRPSDRSLIEAFLPGSLSRVQGTLPTACATNARFIRSISRARSKSMCANVSLALWMFWFASSVPSMVRTAGMFASRNET